MLFIAIIPALVMLVGGLVFALTSNVTAKELGRLAFFAGLLVLMFALAGHVVRLSTL